MIEIAVTRALQQLRFGDSRRALRQLVEYGQRYSHSDFSSRLFASLDDMLHSADHPYYEAFQELVSHVDGRYLLDYGINLGYDSWTTFRKRQRALGLTNRSWYTIVHLDEPGLQVMARMQSCYQQGIYAFFLYTNRRPDPALLQQMCAAFPKGALTIFLPDKEVSASLLDALEGTPTLALVPCKQHGRFTSVDMLREHRRLFFLCRTLDAGDLASILSSGELPPEENVFIVYLADAEVNPSSAQCFSAFVHEKLKAPSQPVVPFFFPDDLFRVERILGVPPMPLPSV